jgi:hypothetical protein
VIGFGALMWSSWSSRHPWVEADAARQVAAAAAYVKSSAPDSDVVYVLNLERRWDPTTVGRWWLVVKAVLPPEQVPAAHRYVGSPDGYLARVPSRPLGEGLPPGETDRPDPALWASGGRGEPVVVVLQRYNPAGFGRAAAQDPMRVVAPGVLVVQGPLPEEPVVAPDPPHADTRGLALAGLGAVVVAVAVAVGSGWALALLPPDPVVRLSLAPALGVAAITLFALGWERVDLPLSGWAGAVPAVLAGAAGWAFLLASNRMRRRAGGPPNRAAVDGGPDAN